jgi:hypothetical protein
LVVSNRYYQYNGYMKEESSTAVVPASVASTTCSSGPSSASPSPGPKAGVRLDRATAAEHSMLAKDGRPDHRIVADVSD